MRLSSARGGNRGSSRYIDGAPQHCVTLCIKNDNQRLWPHERHLQTTLRGQTFCEEVKRCEGEMHGVPMSVGIIITYDRGGDYIIITVTSTVPMFPGLSEH